VRRLVLLYTGCAVAVLTTLLSTPRACAQAGVSTTGAAFPLAGASRVIAGSRAAGGAAARTRHPPPDHASEVAKIEKDLFTAPPAPPPESVPHAESAWTITDRLRALDREARRGTLSLQEYRHRQQAILTGR
jgi:hypothetical protein